eukprot:Awhi_evm1s7494
MSLISNINQPHATEYKNKTMSLISNINQPQLGKDVLPAPSVSIVEKELDRPIPHEEELTKATKLSIAREFHELSHAYPRSIYNLMKRT